MNTTELMNSFSECEAINEFDAKVVELFDWAKENKIPIFAILSIIELQLFAVKAQVFMKET